MFGSPPKKPQVTEPRYIPAAVAGQVRGFRKKKGISPITELNNWTYPLSLLPFPSSGASTLAAAGNYLLPYPAALARARWAQRQLTIVRAMRDADPGVFRKPVYLRVEDEHKFHSFDRTGLAYALDMRMDDFVPLSPEKSPPNSSPILVVPTSGDVHW